MQQLKQAIIEGVMDATDLDTQQVSLSILDNYLDLILTPEALQSALSQASGSHSIPPAANPPLVNGQPPIFHVVMDRRKFGLSEEGAKLQDMAEEYAVVADEKANAGLIVYGNYNGVWRVNPWSTRFLIRILLENSGVSLPI